MKEKELKKWSKENLLSKEKEILNLKEEESIKKAYEYAEEGLRFQNIDILNMEYQGKSISSVVSSKWHFQGFSKEEFSKLKDVFQTATNMFSNERIKLSENINILNTENENGKTVALHLAENRQRFSLKTLNKLTQKFETASEMLCKFKPYKVTTADDHYYETVCLNKLFIEKNPEILSLESSEGELLIESIYKKNKDSIKLNYLNYLTSENMIKTVDLMVENSQNFNLEEVIDLNELAKKKIILEIQDSYGEEELIMLSKNNKNRNLIHDITVSKIESGFVPENDKLLNLKKKNIIGFDKGKSISEILSEKNVSYFLKNKVIESKDKRNKYKNI
jgi:hypothetical protein